MEKDENGMSNEELLEAYRKLAKSNDELKATLEARREEKEEEVVEKTEEELMAQIKESFEKMSEEDCTDVEFAKAYLDANDSWKAKTGTSLAVGPTYNFSPSSKTFEKVAPTKDQIEKAERFDKFMEDLVKECSGPDGKSVEIYKREHVSDIAGIDSGIINRD